MAQTVITLNNGAQIPQFGLGVYQIPDDEDAKETVKTALSLGYRHIDTAHAYQNERGVGAGLHESGLPRDAVWLTSKLWPTEYATADTAIDAMLARLGTDYLDLLLLHQQIGPYQTAWRLMETALAAGKVRAIGISNFDGERLTDILDFATVKPAVMQMELHPYQQQLKLREQLKPYGTAIEAWYPLGHGDKTLLSEPVFTELAAKYGKTNAQIILRWHIQEGTIVFPRSTQVAHLQENIDIFDFELTADDMGRIRALDAEKPYFTLTYEEQKERFMAFHPEISDEANRKELGK